ncbi:hypothetical protein KFK09_002480 [Dendrobium nobile]|uniref:Uncharacterized protein n=1 Tax=Dendrobium nobile TaxID=94219 RepID=A0A8T3C1F2_DENNO|nr:hypothetical protein KFK09_002480 [Dendrobium nobile]
MLNMLFFEKKKRCMKGVCIFVLLRLIQVSNQAKSHQKVYLHLVSLILLGD